jgi:hypothetical protein
MQRFPRGDREEDNWTKNFPLYRGEAYKNICVFDSDFLDVPIILDYRLI